MPTHITSIFLWKFEWEEYVVNQIHNRLRWEVVSEALRHNGGQPESCKLKQTVRTNENSRLNEKAR